MVQKAVDYETAQEVAIAETLAKLGASPVLIGQLTDFGSRWIRSLVRRYNGPLCQKPKDPLRRLADDPDRLLDGGAMCLVMYEFQPVSLSPGARLIEAYLAYRDMPQHTRVLDINECAWIIELYRTGSAWLRPCRVCRIPHFVVTENAICAVCALSERVFCKHCHQPLEPRGASRQYHEQCARESLRERRRSSARPRLPGPRESRTFVAPSRFTGLAAQHFAGCPAPSQRAELGASAVECAE
jgi:hypothetical protein